MDKFDIIVPPATPADWVTARMAGVMPTSKPVGYFHARNLVLTMKEMTLKEDDARKILRDFVRLTIDDPDDVEGILSIADDILDNPENAHNHYTTFKLKKKDGGFRTIEAPEKLLKRFQQVILNRWWYAKSRPPKCVHGFVPTRGVLTNAQAHVEDGVFGKDKTLIKVDIRDFFMSVTRSSIMNFLLNDLGYSLLVSKKPRKFPRILMDILETSSDWSIPAERLSELREKGVHEIGRGDTEFLPEIISAEIMLDHILLRLCCLDERLPQGSPCSPALANVFMKSFNNILQSRLKSRLKCHFTSTIYADDSTTTLGSVADKDDITMARNTVVGGIMTYPDISVNFRKIGVFKHGHSQKITGVSITDKLSIPRQDRDKVRAELHNAASGKKKLTDEDKLRLRGVRAWMRGVDKEGWDARCEKDFLEAVGR